MLSCFYSACPRVLPCPRVLRDDSNDSSNILRDANELQSQITEMLVRRYQNVFGHSMAYLTSNTEVVHAFVNHPDPGFRNLALSFLARYEKPLDSTKTLIMQKARQDRSTSVRKCAISILAKIRNEESDLAISLFLKSVVYDECEEPEVRRGAYFGISSVDRYGDFMNIQSFRFPEEVDWEYLDYLVPGNLPLDRHPGE